MKIAPVQKQTKAGQRTRFRVRTVLSIPLLAFRPFCHVRDAKRGLLEDDDKKPSSPNVYARASV